MNIWLIILLSILGGIVIASAFFIWIIRGIGESIDEFVKKLLE